MHSQLLDDGNSSWPMFLSVFCCTNIHTHWRTTRSTNTTFWMAENTLDGDFTSGNNIFWKWSDYSESLQVVLGSLLICLLICCFFSICLAAIVFYPLWKYVDFIETKCLPYIFDSFPSNDATISCHKPNNRSNNVTSTGACKAFVLYVCAKANTNTNTIFDEPCNSSAVKVSLQASHHCT